jgi:hypothetical protein
MKYYDRKAEAFEAGRASGLDFRVYREVRNIPASGANRPYTRVRYFVRAA